MSGDPKNESITLTAANLSREHIGSTIRVREGDSEFTDVLRGVSHIGDLIEDPKMFQEVPDFLVGRVATTLTFLRAGEVSISGNSAIELVAKR